jgi:ABC-2 type transport system permease protein
MKTWSITLKDLQLLLKDRGSLFQYFILPLIFILVFSGALSSIGSTTKDTRLALAVVDLDIGSGAQALLGGCIAPAFLLDRYLGPLPKIVPHYWANRAFDDLLISGLGLQDVALELAVLLGFAILFFVIGVWRFDFE